VEAAAVKNMSCRRLRGVSAAALCFAIVCAPIVCWPSRMDPFFIGVTYSPYHREGQNPRDVVEITEEQIRADLDIIAAAGFRYIRCYGLENGLDRMVPVASRHFRQLKFFLGIYVCGLGHDDLQNPRSTRAQMNAAIHLANRYRNVAGIVVGNECLAEEPEACSQPVSVDRLIDDLNYVRNALDPEVRSSITVTTAMSMVAAVKNHASQGRRIAENCDVIMVNIHPFFAPAAIETAGSADVDGSYQRLEELYASGGKPIIIGEIGWPSAGAPNGPAVPGRENQRKFVRDLTRYASDRGIRVFLFEMFDEPWKHETGGVGPHWGLLDRHGRAKFPMPWPQRGLR
jgi:exo-beta-1,3-glucanase (GH17 family)